MPSADIDPDFDQRGRRGRRHDREAKSIAISDASWHDQRDLMRKNRIACPRAGLTTLQPDFAAAAARGTHVTNRDVERHREARRCFARGEIDLGGHGGHRGLGCKEIGSKPSQYPTHRRKIDGDLVGKAVRSRTGSGLNLIVSAHREPRLHPPNTRTIGVPVEPCQGRGPVLGSALASGQTTPGLIFANRFGSRQGSRTGMS